MTNNTVHETHRSETFEKKPEYNLPNKTQTIIYCCRNRYITENCRLRPTPF